MEITKENFESYEAVRESGVTNMFAINTVCDLSELEKIEVMDIIKNYSEYKEKFIK